MPLQTAPYWINRLNLQPHPEGGYYTEVFRSNERVAREGSIALKQACTSIYYLLESIDFSGFHRLRSDELWYFHQGSPLLIHAIDQAGQYTAFELSDSSTGNLSVAIPAGRWFASEIRSGSGFALVSCAVAPGFDFTEFEMGEKAVLVTLFPQHAEILGRLCRD